MSTPAGGRKKRGEIHDEHPDERWTVSYMDMITVLMCLFVVLYSMSAVEEDKYAQLKASLASGFGQVEEGKVDTAEGIVVPPDAVDEEGEATDLEMAMQEVQQLREIQDQIAAGLEREGLSDTVRFEIDERGLTVRLVSADTFFAAEQADLTGQAEDVLDIIGPALAPTPYEISVEGHADQRATARYDTNWELSSARATQVVRHLITDGGVRAPHIAAVGFGDSRPITPGVDEASLAMNRRVDIMALSDAPEVVRSLIPEVVAED